METKQYENVTVLFQSEFYGISQIFCKTLTIEYKEYAQYPRATWIVFRAPRKRKNQSIVKAYDQTLAVIPGQVPAYDSFRTVKESNDCTISEGKYSACDPRWADELINFAKSAGACYLQDQAGNEID